MPAQNHPALPRFIRELHSIVDTARCISSLAVEAEGGDPRFDFTVESLERLVEALVCNLQLSRHDRVHFVLGYVAGLIDYLEEGDESSATLLLDVQRLIDDEVQNV